MWNTYCTSLAVAVEVNPGQCIVKYFVKYRHSQFREREQKKEVKREKEIDRES